MKELSEKDTLLFMWDVPGDSRDFRSTVLLPWILSNTLFTSMLNISPSYASIATSSMIYQFPSIYQSYTGLVTQETRHANGLMNDAMVILYKSTAIYRSISNICYGMMLLKPVLALLKGFPILLLLPVAVIYHKTHWKELCHQHINFASQSNQSRVKTGQIHIWFQQKQM